MDKTGQPEACYRQLYRGMAEKNGALPVGAEGRGLEEHRGHSPPY